MRKDGRILTYEEGIDRKMIKDAVVVAESNTVVAVPTSMIASKAQQIDVEKEDEQGNNNIGINGDVIGK